MFCPESCCIGSRIDGGRAIYTASCDVTQLFVCVWDSKVQGACVCVCRVR